MDRSVTNTVSFVCFANGGLVWQVLYQFNSTCTVL